MRMSEVVVLGSGFAGLWAALGAARRLDELGAAHGDVTITVISSQPYHDIRVRNYEADLTRLPHPAVGGVGPGRNWAHHRRRDGDRCGVAHRDHHARHARYDRLVVALGSRVVKPDIPGLREFGFDVDTYDAAMRLQRHLASLKRPGCGRLPSSSAPD